MSLPAGFRQLKTLTPGYFATVTACVDPHGRKVALKRLQVKHADNTSYRARFEREIEITSSLKNLEGVVRILDTGAHENLPYYTMPLADSNLFEYVRVRNSVLSELDRVALCRNVLSTMAEAHACGTIHRDLSPQNVLVYLSDSEPEVRIADFGLGKTEGALMALTTSSHANYGHALYVSPEQREKLSKSTSRSDVYSLGRLLDFVMTGRDPDNAEKHSLRPAARGASHADPIQRFEDAQALLAAFEQQVRLVHGDGEAALDTFSDLASLDKNIEWGAVHRLLTVGQKSGKAYYGYLEPVITFFETPGRLAQYAKAVGASFDEFVIRFCKEVDTAGGEVGWPFSASGSFYDMQAQLLPLCSSTEAKLACFESLWGDAYRSDQWSAQRAMRRYFATSTIDSHDQAEFAARIAEIGGKYVNDEDLSAAPTGPIKNAIRQLIREKISN